MTWCAVCVIGGAAKYRVRAYVKLPHGIRTRMNPFSTASFYHTLVFKWFVPNNVVRVLKGVSVASEKRRKAMIYCPVY